MMRNEAAWFAEVLERFAAEELSPLLNLGSSTREFRERVQPYIQERVFAPLERRGVRTIHCDLKEGEGVDVAADIFDDGALERLRAMRPRALFCTHMFEHVEDREALAARILGLLPPGGLFFVTVPNSYPYHPDPIDTLYRPTPGQLAALFGQCRILDARVITDGYYWSKLRKKPWLIVRHLLRIPTPFIQYQRWKHAMGKLYWLFRPYRVTCLIGRKG